MEFKEIIKGFELFDSGDKIGHIEFSEREGVAGRVEELALEFEKMCGASSETAFGFFARMGRSDEPKSRSLRLELDELMK